MQTLINKLSLLFLSCPFVALAQEQNGNYSMLPLKDLTAFESSVPNWSVQGGVTINPNNASKPRFTAGEGILIGTPGNLITTKLKAADLRLSMEFMVSPGAEGYIILPGNQKLLISDSGRKPAMDAHTSGYLGQFPTQNAAKVPGLWQTLELAYDASVPLLPQSGRLNKLSLNGVTVLETVYLPLDKHVDSAPISFEVKKGTIAFRNIGYQLLASRKPATLTDMSYKLYADKWDSKTFEKLDHEGKADALTQEVSKGLREFHLFYEGNIDIREGGEYQFTSIYQGNVFTLDIDGKSVIQKGESSSQESHTGAITLSPGKHPFKIHYSRFPWMRPALGLRVEKAGIRSYDLHALSSLPEPEPKPYISVKPEMKPEMVRSFILLDGETSKRTHCISVGNPQGWNYTVDLNRGALLQAWKGQFANVTEMWYQRGEPQLLYPAGLTVPVSGKSSFAILADNSTTWPDSSDINFKGYQLDQGGTPTFKYAIGGAEITDKLTSEYDGITRTLQINGTSQGNVYALLAQGKDIVLIEKGLYQIDNRYFIRLDKKAQVILRPKGDGKEMLLPVGRSSAYTMFW